MKTFMLIYGIVLAVLYVVAATLTILHTGPRWQTIAVIAGVGVYAVARIVMACNRPSAEEHKRYTGKG